MSKVFDDIRKTFSQAAEDVARKSGKVLEISRLTLAISSLNSDIREQYETIGKLIYAGYQEQTVPTDAVSAHCEAINAKLAEIEQHRRKIQQLKNTPGCSRCGAQTVPGSEYCARCGAPL